MKRNFILFNIIFGYCFSLNLCSAFALDQRLTSVRSFAFALGVDCNNKKVLNSLSNYDLVVIDAEEASAKSIKTLRQRGVIVLGYLSIGTIEPYRSWYKSLKKYRLAYWADWGEWIADVNQSGYRQTITQKIMPGILKKKFDGLFLDNFDTAAERPNLETGMLQLIQEISNTVRGAGGLLFAQNGDSLVESITSYIDGWNREDVTSTFDFDSNKYRFTSEEDRNAALETLQKLHNLGLLTLAMDYVKKPENEATTISKNYACSVEAIPYSSTIELDKINPLDLRCE